MKTLHYLTLLLFLFLASFAFAQTSVGLDRALEQLQNELNLHSLSADDLSEFRVSDQYQSRHNGVNHFYLTQQFQGVDLRNAILGVHLDASGELFHVTSNFVADRSRYIQNSAISLSAESALQKAAEHLELSDWGMSTIIQAGEGASMLTFFDKGNLSLEDIKVQLSYIPLNDKEWTLAWLVNIYELDAQHRWEVFVDAASGQILGKQDHVIHCKWDHPETACQADAHVHLPAKAPSHLNTNQAFAAPNQYGVYPIPVESPAHGSASVADNPGADNPEASPFGWHDTNGASGAEFTITRGNNVHAYQDQNNINSSSGDEPNGGATLDFSGFIPNLNQSPFNYTDEAVVNLFYWCNVMHDVWYNYGFDELSGNFQENNYGKGGSGGDYIRAEAQDAANNGTRDNANFSSGGDGSTARIQMYLWSAVAGDALTVNSPANVAGSYPTSGANFGPSLPATPLTRPLVFVDDGSANPTLGCSGSAAGAYTNRIAMIDRGTCDFSEKVYNAQLAGADAVIICNNVAGGTFTMGAGINAGLVTIPSVMISQGDCATIRAELPGVSVILQDPGSFELDGDFDNGIIAHEYGHGISIRMTGGPSAGGCLGNSEQMGEGWSDYFGLMMTIEPGDDGSDLRGIGTYVLGQPNNGTGIRPAPYSTDFAVNGFTYGDITNTGQISQPHGVGFLWCTMLWDLTWDLIDIYGFDPDFYNGTGGNNIAMQLVMDGIKLQGCSPGFIDGRDAILAADEANYGGIHQCVIWEAFARRGLGASASQGSENSRTDGSEAFDLPTPLSGVHVEKTANLTEVTEGQTIEYSLNIRTICNDATILDASDDLPNNATYVNGSASNGGTLNGGDIDFSTLAFLDENSEVTYTLSAEANFGAFFDPITVLDDDIEGGAGNWATGGTGGFWSLSGANPNSGSTSWFVPNQASASEIVLQTASAFTPTGKATLSFFHTYDTERTWDGGVVEISTDNGSNWQDLGQHMTLNGYNAFLNESTTNSINRRPAFTGNSNGYLQTTIDLCSFSGETLLIRFRMGSDGSVGGNGWFIDDISIIDEAAIVNRVNVTTSNNGDAQDAICTKVNALQLPLELIGIDAFAKEDHIELTWSTAAEIGIQGFEIERRAENESQFIRIASTEAKGSASRAAEYDYQDRDVLPGVRYYYRILILEETTENSYSPVVTAKLDKDAISLELFPQPADEQVQLTVVSPSNENISLNIVDATGKLIRQQNLEFAEGYQQLSLDVSALGAGVYFIQISGADFQVNRKLVIQ
ncbi:MAG: T9SS-dependent M36 family metallopeptidase [Bacteroidota bacterium]